MFILGLTGSIGMGKSTTAAMFREAGVPLYDADAGVHGLYAGAAAPLVEAAFPGTTQAGVVDRARLGAKVIEDPAALAHLEAIIHPLVRADRDLFLTRAQGAGARLVVLDIPLLFETGGDELVDAVACVSAPETVQKARVEHRPGMTPARLAAIMAKQMPDREKRRRAHFVIDTSRDFPETQAQVLGILRALAGAPGRKAWSRDA